MTAPLFFLDPGTLSTVKAGQVVRLDGAEGRHAATVRRIDAGEAIQLADGSGRIVGGVVEETGPDTLIVLVDDVCDDPVPGPTFTLVQALAKGDRDLQAVEAATELGVDTVVPWQAERSIVQWRGERGQRAHRKWESVAKAAAKQARRARIPAVEEIVDRSGLTARVGRADTAIVLHEEAHGPLATVSLPERGEVLLVVGPEGGITDQELDGLRSAGAHVARLGRTVLRSSSAGPAALAVLSSRTRW